MDRVLDLSSEGREFDPMTWDVKQQTTFNQSIHQPKIGMFVDFFYWLNDVMKVISQINIKIKEFYKVHCWKDVNCIFPT